MNKYDMVDSVINDWVVKNSLLLFTTCKDEEARMVRITDTQGRVYGIGIDPPNGKQVTVRFYAWDFKKRNRVLTTSFECLPTVLDEALDQVRKWAKV